MSRWRERTATIAFSGILWGAAASSTLDASAQSASGPAAVFEKKCYSCHNIGGGDKRGPDLKGVPGRRPKEWLRDFVKSPATMQRKGDATAVALFRKFVPEVMPDQDIADDQIDALMAFIDDLSRKNETFVAAGARLSRAIAPADVPAGLGIFTGKTALSAGGAPCMACHTLRALGKLGGGTLGPDLTAANIKYRDPELISILQNPNFPTMSTVFASRPLSDEEIVRLFALLQDSKLKNPAAPVQAQAGAAAAELWLPAIGFAGLIFALAGADRLWRNRFRGVREQLVRGRHR